MVATRLTKRSVDGLVPRGKPFIVFDDTVKGFGCRVMPTGVKVFVVEYRPGAGGRGVNKKRLTLGHYGAMAVDQARQAALDALADIRQGHDPQAEKSRQRGALSVADMIDAFLADHVGKKLKPKTYEAYAIALAKVTAAFGSVKAESLTRAQVASLHKAMFTTPHHANKLLSVLSSAFVWSETQGLIPEGHANPATKITRYKEQGRERFLTAAELERLGAALRAAEIEGIDPYATAAIRVLIFSGARCQEILSARWSYLDVERGMLFLPDSKTGKKPIVLSVPALAALEGLPRLAGNPYIFPGRKEGAPRVNLVGPWKAITRHAGLEGLRVHDIRHGFASVGVAASLGLPVIGALLGHSRPQTTARYAHLANDPVRAAAEVIGAKIAESLDGAK
jgi:integrase